MRTRKEIEGEMDFLTNDNSFEGITAAATKRSLEVLLDIRELLENPPNSTVI